MSARAKLTVWPSFAKATEGRPGTVSPMSTAQSPMPEIPVLGNRFSGADGEDLLLITTGQWTGWVCRLEGNDTWVRTRRASAKELEVRQ
jgi:hypothetical protein